MTRETFIAVENGVGIIRLNRPGAINALTPDMILSISDALQRWRNDEGVRLVLFEGEGERGFCAGGDVRWTRDVLLGGDREKAFRFFALEYDMNRMIAVYEKPVVALTHGVVMGGGIGLAGHARYRIALGNARFAMPEAAIGFFCDVGVRSILARAQRHRALMFMLAGTLVGAADAIALGLSDVWVRAKERDRVRARLMEAGEARNVGQALDDIMKTYARDPGPLEFCALADDFRDVFAGHDYAEIVPVLERHARGHGELASVAEIILSRCPTSNQVHVLGHDAAVVNSDIGAVLEADLRLARLLAPREDFIEGVRAVLVDKDHSPRWRPAAIGDVDTGAIILALEGTEPAG